MSDTEQSKELLAVAERELRALRGMLDSETFADELFGFVAQQSLEKALKAWLSAIGELYPFTHDLLELVSRLKDAGQRVDDLADLAEFNPFAVQLRYSAFGVDEEDPVDRNRAIDTVDSVLARVRGLISSGGSG